MLVKHIRANEEGFVSHAWKSLGGVLLEQKDLTHVKTQCSLRY